MGTDSEKPDRNQVAGTPHTIPCGEVKLTGDLYIPPDAVGIVLFAHGSGSGRHSPRNRYVAERLHREKLGTLLFDLLTVEEEREDMMTGTLRFNVPLLARRLICATDWVKSNPVSRNLPIGYFGSSTGAAAALTAGAAKPASISAIVSRGGRPDLCIEALRTVSAPTLLIVGEKDLLVLKANQEAHAELRCPGAIELVPGATHLFEEPGALEYAADLAAEWFAGNLSASLPKKSQPH